MEIMLLCVFVEDALRRKDMDIRLAFIGLYNV